MADLARISSCQTIRGELAISGGALAEARPLAGLQRVNGSVHIGPTLALPAVDVLVAVEDISGALVIDANLAADGVYLPALHHIGGDLVITGNTALGGVNAPLVAAIGGDAILTGNPSLARIGLDSLTAVAGNLDISRNAVLDDLAMAALTRVGGALRIEDNPRLPASLVTELDARIAHGDEAQ